MQSSLRMHSFVTFNSILDFPTAAAHWLFTICRLLRLLHSSSSSCSSACSSTERTTKDTNYKQRNYYARCRGIQFDVIAPVCVLHGSGLLIWKREQSRVGWRQPLYYYIILYYIIISAAVASLFSASLFAYANILLSPPPTYRAGRAPSLARIWHLMDCKSSCPGASYVQPPRLTC